MVKQLYRCIDLHRYANYAIILRLMRVKTGPKWNRILLYFKYYGYQYKYYILKEGENFDKYER